MSCPICGKPTERAYRPFCSKPCADRDLLHWLNGRYAVPDPDEEDMSTEHDEVQIRAEKRH